MTMRFSALAAKADKLMLFNKAGLRLFESKQGNLDLNVGYWLKTGKLISLKKGWYLLAAKYAGESDKGGYLEFIANKLIEPSYLSGEYVLSKYGVLTEAVTAVTSITTSPKRELGNKLAIFRYYSLSPALFCGYRLGKGVEGQLVLEAELAKALFDFLYVRFLRKQPIDAQAVADLRINWENISAQDFQKSKTYLKAARSCRMAKLYDLIQQKYYAARNS